MKRKSGGFTLIELVIVVAVIAIIAAIAVPLFNDQIRKSRRSEAVSTLQSWQLQMEQWRTNNPSYANLAASPNYPATPAAITFYTFAISDQSPTAYTLTATARAGQERDRASGAVCTPLTIQMNAGVITKNPPACW